MTRLVIDHCHDTGVFRGLLCAHCNAGLGYFEDNIDWMDEAIRYVIRSLPDYKVVAGGCATCGCLEPANKHGDRRNITVSELKDSALKTRVSPKSMSTALRNVRRTLKVARRK